MQIIKIDISDLVNLRETLQLKRGVFHSFVLSFLFGTWWLFTKRFESLTFYESVLHILIVIAMLVPILATILIRKNNLARIIYLLILVLNILLSSIFPIALIIKIIPFKNEGENYFYVAILSLILIYYLIAIKHSYRLFFSLVGFARGKTLKQEISYTLRLLAGEWRRFDNTEPKLLYRNRIDYSLSGGSYRLFLGVLSFCLGVVFLLISLFCLLEPRFIYYIFSFDILGAWGFIKSLSAIPRYSSQGSIWLEFLGISFLALIAGFCFFVFGFFRHQRRRENIPIYESFLSKSITQSDILLLRSFKDDVKAITKSPNPFLLPFNLYLWDYTLERTIVDRLKSIGKVHLLDERKENAKLLDKWFLKFFVQYVSKEIVIKFLKFHFPMVWFKLPPPGGIRHYLPISSDNHASDLNVSWQNEIIKSMLKARIQIVIIGKTENLDWEMNKIEELNLFKKTFYVMPPLILKRNVSMRWQEFISYLDKTHIIDTESLLKINPRRILGVMVREDKLIVITAKNSTYLFHESAIDIASILIVTDKNTSNLFISKYI